MLSLWHNNAGGDILPLKDSCGFLIKQINDALAKQSNNTLRSQDLTLAQLTVLIWLNELPDKTAPLKELERALGVAQSTAAGIVSRLEQKEFVEGFGDPSDKRIKMLRIMPKGEQCYGEARLSMDETEGKLLAGLDEEEKTTLARLLQKVKSNLN